MHLESAAADVKSESNARGWKYFADEINTVWRKRAADSIRCGQLLIDANNELRSDTYSAMLKQLHFNTSTAKKLICIAKNSILSSHVNQLPPNYSTLYELSQLNAETLLAALANGTIHPGMQRKDAIALKPKSKKTPTGSTDTIGTAWKAASKDQRRKFLDELGRDGLCGAMSGELLARLRDHVIGAEIAGASKSSTFAVYATDKLHAALRCAEQPDPENIRIMTAALGCIVKMANTKNVTRSDIVIAEGKPKIRRK